MPCDIHVSRLFMTGGTSGRTRVQRGNETQPVRLTRTLYAGERKERASRGGGAGKKIETTPWPASTVPTRGAGAVARSRAPRA